MIYVLIPLALGVGYFSGYRKGYLKAMETYIYTLREIAKQAEKGV